jgi:hypothetical protein
MASQEQMHAQELMKRLEGKHVLAALGRIDKGENGAFADSTKFDLIHEGRQYPPKRVVGIALNELSGDEFGPYSFKGGSNSPAFRALDRLDFVVLPKKEHRRSSTKKEASKQALDAQLMRAIGEAEGSGEFDPVSPEDARTRTLRAIVTRQGQPKFRRDLLVAYGRRCAISGCDVVHVLEAAHIIPYKGKHTNTVKNGLLLRADLHTLFDLGLLKIDPESFAIVLAPQLANTAYEKELGGAVLRPPASPSQRPDRDALLIQGQMLLAA